MYCVYVHTSLCDLLHHSAKCLMVGISLNYTNLFCEDIFGHSTRLFDKVMLLRDFQCQNQCIHLCFRKFAKVQCI